jgi:hypothetical protein
MVPLRYTLLTVILGLVVLLCTKFMIPLLFVAFCFWYASSFTLAILSGLINGCVGGKRKL